MRRTSTIVLLLTAASGLAVLTGAAPAGAADVVGRSFRAPVPDGWTSATVSRSGARAFSLASKGRLDSANIPAKGRLGIATLEAPLTAAGRRMSVSELASGVVGVPRAATDVRRAGRGATTVNGQKAVSVRVTYLFKGRRLAQRSVVTRRGTRLIYIEAIADASRGTASARVLQTYVSGWRWR
jgi:hypothetical protein